MPVINNNWWKMVKDINVLKISDIVRVNKKWNKRRAKAEVDLFGLDSESGLFAGEFIITKIKQDHPDNYFIYTHRKLTFCTNKCCVNGHGYVFDKKVKNTKNLKGLI